MRAVTSTPVTKRSTVEERVLRLESRIQRLGELSDDERLVLATLSLFPVRVTRSELASLCRYLGVLLGGRAPDTTKLSAWARKCKECELLEWDGAQFSVEPDLGLFLVRLVGETAFGDRMKVGDISRARSTLQASSAWMSRTFEARLLRCARRPGDAGILVAQVLREKDSPIEPALFFGPGDPVFAAMHVPDFDQLLVRLFKGRLAQLQDVSWELEIFAALSAPDASVEPKLLLRMDRASIAVFRAQFTARRVYDSEPFRSTWLLWKFLKGDLDAVRLRAGLQLEVDAAMAKSHLAAVALAEGKLQESLALFAEAVAEGNHKGLAPFHGTWLGALQVTALLAERSAASLDNAQLIIQKLIGKGTKLDGCEISGAFSALARFANHLGVVLGPLRDAEWDEQEVFTNIALLLCAIWSEVAERDAATWKQVAQIVRGRAEVVGFGWVVAEMDALGARLSSKPASATPPREASGARHLVELVVPRAPWESTLEKLEQVAASAAQSSRTGESPKVGSRIAWLVQPFGDLLHVEPRLQTKKGDRFTRGRAIALQHFVSPTGAELPMTPADVQVRQHIREERHYYGSTALYFEDSVCLGLVGHPLVFDSEDEDLHYEVKRGQVTLRCDHQANGDYVLRLEPSVASVFKCRGDNTKAFIRRRGNEITAYEVTADLKRLALLVGQELTIPCSGEARLRGLLPRLSAMIPTTASLIAAEGAEVVPGDSLPVLRIHPKGDTLRMQMLVTPFGPGGMAYIPGTGSEVASLFTAGDAQHVRRDLEEERSRATALWQRLSVLGQMSDDSTWVAPDLPNCLQFLVELGALPKEEARIEWPEGQPLRVKRVRRLTVNVSGGNAAQWFDVDGSLVLDDGAELRIFEVLEKLERRLGRFVTLSNGDFAELTQSAIDRLTLLQSYSDHEGTDGSLRVAPWLALALPQAVGQGCVETGTDAWQKWRERAETSMHREYVPSKHFVGELRDYQRQGFNWLCRMASLGTGVCLADDMGLGKTVQALALLQHRATRKANPGEVTGPMLIVAPASVCPGWVAEARRFTPNLEPRWLTGKERSLAQPTRKTLLICTYEVMLRDIEALAQVTFDTVVLDEAHQIKNAHTRRARAAFSLNAAFRLATTGTPIENHLGELWSLFNFLMPGLLGDQHRFVERFRSPIENDRDQQRKAHLRALVQPFLLRRTKQLVLSELPGKTEVVREVQLSQPEIEIYEAVRHRGLEALSEKSRDKNQQRIRVLAELMRLRRACCHPRLVLPDSEVPSSKLQALLELVNELGEAGHRALVFSQFVDHLTLVREALDDLGVSYQYLDGSTKPTDRGKVVDAFQSGSGELFLISLRAGGIGLNLTAADYVIHLDPWWNPAVEDQASDRAYRIGQERPVTIYRLITAGTIEQKLIALHSEKRTLAADILANSESVNKLDPEELMNLLRSDLDASSC
jgi:superfamily II DNA or RNA helicase